TAYMVEFEKKEKKLYSPACFQLWTAPQINWDGKLLGCCVNHFGDFGNVFDEGLDNLLQSEKYVYAKKMLLGEAPDRKDIPCSQCNRYKKVLQMPFKEQLNEELNKTKMI
ncbi:MAG: SPASM domain-containing protein, partial [Raineya sp.]